MPAFTLPTVTLAVSAHLAGGGRPPDVGTVVVLLGSVALLSAAVSARRQNLPRLLLGVVLVQAGVHIALLGHHTPASAQAVGGPLMVPAHALASVVLAWWLTKGEAALWGATADRLRTLSRLVTLTPVRAGLDRPVPSGRRTPALDPTSAHAPGCRAPPASA
ncbi:MAG TPA: hypothetical protein VMT69_03530 [Kineosporiaceae bacterium]|nr:hypothetical protein [Kineosporiaceae bacterium]